MQYWSAASENGALEQPAFTLHLTRPDSLRRMFLPPTELTLAEAFLRGDFDIVGDLEAATSVADHLARAVRTPAQVARLLRRLLSLPRADRVTGGAAPLARRADYANGQRHTRPRDAAAIRAHYDVGNEFYALWLDREQVYSCAYFADGIESLDDAQVAKLDLICRKLRLRPGERFLDIGCGWGALIRHATRHYGVRATGITLSPAQADVARDRIAAEGLEGQCGVAVCDYRELVGGARFDKVASVGMFEHVGTRHLREYFSTVHRVLQPGGLFLNHGIISLDDARARDGRRPRLLGQGRFIGQHVFPDGELPTLTVAISGAELVGFETRDVESLREHYAITLRHWVARLTGAAPSAASLVGDATVRTWRLYMAASAHAFATGRIGIVQVLLARPDDAGHCPLPRTRADLYLGPEGRQSSA